MSKKYIAIVVALITALATVIAALYKAPSSGNTVAPVNISPNQVTNSPITNHVDEQTVNYFIPDTSNRSENKGTSQNINNINSPNSINIQDSKINIESNAQ